jgi:hypothetical protein
MIKNILYIVISAVLLCACEVIREEDRLVPIPRQEYKTNRTHVLVEYTGFRCINCPAAAELAQSLVQLYDTQLIVVAMHPKSNPFTQGALKYNYTCPEADAYYQFMGGTKTTPFPVGNIDMRRVENHYLINPNEWAAKLNCMMGDSTHIALTVEAETDTVIRTVNLGITICSDSVIDCRLALWLVEDSVLGAQAMPDGTNNTAYFHRHLFRQTLGDEIWGTPLHITGKTDICHSTLILLPECNLVHCCMVAVLFDKDDYHILNAKQTPFKIKKP